jgi:hypothetical protein
MLFFQLSSSCEILCLNSRLPSTTAAAAPSRLVAKARIGSDLTFGAGEEQQHHHLLPAQMGCERRGIKQHQFKRERERELTLMLYTFASLTKYPTLAQGATKSEQLPLGALLLFNSTHTLATAAQVPPLPSTQLRGKKNSRRSQRNPLSL